MKIIQGGLSLKAELAAKIAEDEQRDEADPRFFEGHDWWQLSPAEQEVFDIYPGDWPRMMNTWHCYECFAGIAQADTFTEAALDAARAAYPEWSETENPNQHFLAFAQAFAGLSHRNAFAVMRKQEADDLRGAIWGFHDGS